MQYALQGDAYTAVVCVLTDPSWRAMHMADDSTRAAACCMHETPKGSSWLQYYLGVRYDSIDTLIRGDDLQLIQRRREILDKIANATQVSGVV